MPLPSLFAAIVVGGIGVLPPAELALDEAGALAGQYDACLDVQAAVIDGRGEAVGNLFAAAEQRCWSARERLSAHLFARADAATAQAELQRLFAAARQRLERAVARHRS